MADILEALYYDYFMEEHKPSPEACTASRAEEEALDKLLPDLSDDAREQLQAQRSDALILSNRDWFREGFRLGVALMLEAL